MKCIKSLLTTSILILLTSCASEDRTDNPENWSGDRHSEWFMQMDWQGQTGLEPDSSIDNRELAVQYHRHKERWDIAFSFLQETDLSTIETGTHELDGRDVFVLVSEYDSKNPEDVPYEAHEEFADIHYVVSGIEYIGHSTLSSASPTSAYDEERDIRFYTAEEYQYLLARSDRFFIFFPQELHSPGIKVEDPVPVKKIVIKVKV